MTGPANASMTAADRSAFRLVQVIREQGWRSFTTSDVLRLERSGLSSKADLDPALVVLTDGEVIRVVPVEAGPKGGRPKRLYSVNPAILGMDL